MFRSFCLSCALNTVWSPIPALGFSLMEHAAGEPATLGSEPACGASVSNKLLGPITDVPCLLFLLWRQLSHCHPALLSKLLLSSSPFVCRYDVDSKSANLSKHVSTKTWRHRVCVCVCVLAVRWGICAFIFFYCNCSLCKHFPFGSFQPHNSDLTVTSNLIIVIIITLLYSSSFLDWPLNHVEIK